MLGAMAFGLTCDRSVF